MYVQRQQITNMDNEGLQRIKEAFIAHDVSVRTDCLLDPDDNGSEVAYLDLCAYEGQPLPHARIREVLARLGVLYGIDREGSHKSKPGYPALVVETEGKTYMTLRDMNCGRRIPVNNWSNEQVWEEPPF